MRNLPWWFSIFFISILALWMVAYSYVLHFQIDTTLKWLKNPRISILATFALGVLLLAVMLGKR